MKKIMALALLLFITALSFAQTSDDAFKKPLKAVIADMESKYGVKIRYTEAQVADRWLTYAGFKLTADAEKSMTAIFGSFDLNLVKAGDKSYRLSPFQYYLKTPEAGKEQLNALAALYHNTAEWEKRKAELKSCILSSLRLAPLPAQPASKPIVSGFRKMDGYTIENVAIETLPGLYVSGSLYRPVGAKGKIPVILNPDGHFANGRYRADAQMRCAILARMGAMAFSYDLFAWGESLLQFKSEDHRRALAQTIQVLNGMRILDYLLSQKDADPARAAITGASGGGSQTMLLSAIDDRIKLSVPVVMLSDYHSGGCPCESGMGVHLCANGTNNVEIAGMAAPRPQLVISDGQDWTQRVPQDEFPFLQGIYKFYGKESEVRNVHLAAEGHDYGPSKRKPMYEFIGTYFKLDKAAADESKVTIEKEPAMYVFGEKGERLPANALKSFAELEKVFERAVTAK
jgi:hypothetical protein